MRKRNIKSIIAFVITIVMMVSLASCNNSSGGGSGDPKEEKEEAEEAEAAQPEEPIKDGKLRISLGGEPETLDPAMNTTVEGASVILHLFSGLAKWSMDEGGKYAIVPDLAEELPEGVDNDDGTISYTYKIKEGAKWSDGQPVTAEDFVFAWKRAGSKERGGGFYYLFDVLDGYSEINTDSEINVEVGDEGELIVKLAEECPYWNELLAFPAFFPVREEVVDNPQWAENPSTIVTNGPYKLTSWNHNSEMTLEKNAGYIGADSIKPEKIEIALLTSVGDMLDKYRSGDLAFIDDVPSSMLESLAEEYPTEFVVGSQLGTYFLNWNINQDLLGEEFEGTAEDRANANADIRKAVNLLIDRTYIADKIGQAGQVPASSFVSMGCIEPDGTQFYENANKDGGNAYAGYFDPSEEAYEKNISEAVEMLKKYFTYDEEVKKFTDFPDLEYIHNVSEGHRAIGEAIQYQLDEFGIHINLRELEWEEFLKTRKEGEYSLARNTWIADYNDPIGFLSLWTSASGHNDVEFGREGYIDLGIYNMDLTGLGLDEEDSEGLVKENATWADTYDAMMEIARTEKDQKARYKVMHKAEDLLMSTGCICPIYFYSDIYMVKEGIKGFYTNPLGYKYFMNVE